MKIKKTSPRALAILALISILLIQFHPIITIADEIPTDFFKGIKLSKQAPTLFLSGETYVFQGEIMDFPDVKEVIIQVSTPEEEAVIFRGKSEDGFFQIPVTFTTEGVTGLIIYPLYRSSNAIFVTVVKQLDTPLKSPFPIESVELVPGNNKTALVLDSQNELFKLNFTQESQTKQLILSGNPSSFELSPLTFKDFMPGEISISISGARSVDGSLFRKTSKWSSSKKLSVNAVVHEFDYINHLKIKNLSGYSSFMKKDEVLNIQGKSLEKYFSKAYVIKPDLRVEKILIQSSGILTNYSVGELYPENSSFLIKFKPKTEGVYILEINSQEGDALLNVPIYVGDLVPVIPNSLELIENYADVYSKNQLSQIRIDILASVNQRRQLFGLESLSLNDELNRFSQSYANALKQAGKIGHHATRHGSLIDRKRKAKIRFNVSENLATSQTPLLALEGLLRSPAHYLQIINPEARIMGIGIAEMEENQTILVQHLAPHLITNQDKEKFISIIINRLNENRKVKLKQLFEHPNEQDTKLSFGPIRASTLEMVEKLVLQEKYINIIDEEKDLNTIFFTRFDQEADGFYFGFVIGQDKMNQ
jgi:uncharacterized protein YkwD